MAFTNNDVSIETRFQLNNSPKNFKITDLADYFGTFGIALTDVIGALVIKNPLGNVIHTTVLPAFDIDLDVSTFIDTIPLPLDSNGDVMKGNYEIEYTIRVAGAVDPGDYTKTFIYCNEYEQATPDVDITVDMLCSKITSTDNTPYQPELTSSALTHTIHPPSLLDPIKYPVTTVSTPVATDTPITTGSWESKIVNIVEFTYSDGLIIDDTIIGGDEKNVKDDINICSLTCNMEALLKRYKDALLNNPENAVNLFNEQLAPALAFQSAYKNNIECGNFDKAEGYYQDVLTFTGSSPECACADSSVPTLIVPICGAVGGQTFVVDACGDNGALVVTPNTVGDTTTYTVCFDDDEWNKLVALTITNITSIDGSITVTPTVSLDGLTTTWDLSVVPSPSTSPIHQFNGILDFNTSNKTIVPAITWRASFSTTVGNKLQEPTTTNVQPIFANFQLNTNAFYLEGYKDQAGGEFVKPLMQLIQFDRVASDSGDAIDRIGEQNPYDIDIIELDTTNDRIYFQIVDTNGNPLGGQQLLDLLDSFVISVTLNA